MRVLFISSGSQVDYQSDMLFHGLRSLPGITVTDANPMRSMYKSGVEEAKQQHGLGMTLYGLLDEDPGVRRDEIRKRIRRQEFDLVVFGNVHRNLEYLSDVLRTYHPSKVAFLDGEDHQVILHALFGYGLYFKRELAGCKGATDRMKFWVRPISFAIPEEKILTGQADKTRSMAFIDPRDTCTYIYRNEADYYADYRRSLFGVTMKKSGWDCLRHYEIMANNCIPYFLDLRSCPVDTMVHLPKEVLLEVNEVILQRGLGYFESPEGLEVWRGFQIQIQETLLKYLTTKALAQYVLESCASLSNLPSERNTLDKVLTLSTISAIRHLAPSHKHEWPRMHLNRAYLKIAPKDR
jgi:hypothetical protein